MKIALLIMGILMIASVYAYENLPSGRYGYNMGYDYDVRDGDYNLMYPKDSYDLRYPHVSDQYDPMRIVNPIRRIEYKLSEESNQNVPEIIPREQSRRTGYYSIGDESYLRYYKLGRYAEKEDGRLGFRVENYRYLENYRGDTQVRVIQRFPRTDSPVSPGTTHLIEVRYS